MNSALLRRLTWFAAVLFVTVVLVPSTAVRAETAKPNPGAATSARTAAENARKQATALPSRYPQGTPEIKKGVEVLAVAYQTLAEAQSKLAEAYTVGLPSEIRAATGELVKANAAIARSTEALTALVNASNYASTTLVANWTKSTPESAAATLEALLISRKKAAAAAKNLAATINPEPPMVATEVPLESIDAARDEWFAADKEAKLAYDVWNDACDIANRTKTSDKYDSAELKARIAELQKADAELAALVKQENDLQLKIRKLKRSAAAMAVELAKPKKK